MAHEKGKIPATIEIKIEHKSPLVLEKYILAKSLVQLSSYQGKRNWLKLSKRERSEVLMEHPASDVGRSLDKIGRMMAGRE